MNPVNPPQNFVTISPVKKAVYACCVLAAFPAALAYRLCAALSSDKAGKHETFYGFSQLYSLLPGRIGSYLRWGFYRLTLKSVGYEAVFGFGCVFSTPETEVGARAYIGPGCNVGHCRIGEDVLLGSGVHVLSGFKQHRFDRLDKPIREQGGEFICISIGQDCWIGNLAVIGADIGAHSVIGAGSVVQKPLPDYAVAAGAPARVLRDRRETPPASP